MNFNQYTITEIKERDRQLVNNFTLCLAPSKYQLIDPRVPSEFKTHTLGGFPKSKVNTALDKALTGNKIEAACYWAFQLMASGSAHAVWDKLIGIICKSINIASPRLPAWIQAKQAAWLRTTVKKELAGPNVLQIRNIQAARNLITELIIVICQSRCRKLDTLVTKIKPGDFVISSIHDRCQVRNNMMISGLLGENDPSEIRLAANEFCFNLVNKNMQGALYWLSWILTWEKMCVKKFRQPFIIQARDIEGIAYADTRDVVWLLWSIIHQVRAKYIQGLRTQMHPSSEIGQCEAQLDALWKTYIHKWKPGSKTKRLPLLVWSMHYLIYPVDWSIPVINRLDIFVKAVSNVNLMFEKIRSQCRSSQSLLQANNNPISVTANGLHMSDIGANNGLNIVIENHFKANPQSDTTQTPELKSNHQRPIEKKNIGFIQSMEKLDIVNKLDKYINT